MRCRTLLTLGVFVMALLRPATAVRAQCDLDVFRYATALTGTNWTSPNNAAGEFLPGCTTLGYCSCFNEGAVSVDAAENFLEATSFQNFSPCAAHTVSGLTTNILCRFNDNTPQGNIVFRVRIYDPAFSTVLWSYTSPAIAVPTVNSSGGNTGSNCFDYRISASQGNLLAVSPSLTSIGSLATAVRADPSLVNRIRVGVRREASGTDLNVGEIRLRILQIPDLDRDGISDGNDTDDDNDGVPDSVDPAPRDRRICQDVDHDDCDDCSRAAADGGPNPWPNPQNMANDGPDADGDGRCDSGDNCPAVSNAAQSDLDRDTIGDACDSDQDNDGRPDSFEPDPPARRDRTRCGDQDNDGCDDCAGFPTPTSPNPGDFPWPPTLNPSADGPDPDLDGRCSTRDNCPTTANPSQADSDGDGLGDACDADDDNDGVPDAPSAEYPSGDISPLDRTRCGDADNDGCDDCAGFPTATNPNPPRPWPASRNTAADGPDTDGDTICDTRDNCRFFPNQNQADSDGDGRGDACQNIDCNNNGAPDLQEILANPALDCDGNSRLDACDAVSPGHPFTDSALFLWRTPAPGVYSTASSWCTRSGLSTPGPSSPVRFDKPGAYTVSLAQNAAARDLTVTAGASPTLALGGRQLDLGANAANDSLIVSGVTGSPLPVLTLRDGLFQAPGRVRIGAFAGHHGALRIDGAGKSFVGTGELRIGEFGSGAMVLQGGGSAFNLRATIGGLSGGTGSVEVVGPLSIWSLALGLFIDNGELRLSSGGQVSASPLGVFVGENGRIVGNGAILGPVSNFGELSPGDPALGGGFGSITVSGNYVQIGEIAQLGDASGALALQIGGTNPGVNADRLRITGSAQLAGGLYLSFAPGYQPAPGDTFPIVSADGPILSQFDVIFNPELTAPALQNKFLRARYSGLRGPGGNGVSIDLADLPSSAGFNSPQDTPLPPGAPAAADIGDLNGDGKPDLAVALSGSPGAVVILFNTTPPGGTVTTFGSSIQLPAANDPRAILIADLDNANGNDVAVANSASDSVFIYRQQATPGVFDSAQTRITVALPPGSAPVAMVAADFDPATDPNPRIDLAVANFGGGGPNTGSLTILRNTGTPTPFVPRTIPMPPGKRPTSLRPTYVDPEKLSDVCVASVDTSNNGSVTAFINGDGSPGNPSIFNAVTPGPENSFPTGPGSIGLLAGNLAPGGASPPSGIPRQDDLVVLNQSGSSVSVLSNTSTVQFRAAFAPAVNYAVGATGQPAPPAGPSTSPRSFVLADLDDDNDLDVVVLGDNSPVQRFTRILRNDSVNIQLGVETRRQIAITPLPSRDQVYVSSCPLELLVADVSGDGRRDLVTLNGACGRGSEPSIGVASNTLPPPGGACCRGSTCAITTQAACAALPGATAGVRYLGGGVACNATGNNTSPCCRADFNQSGSSSVQDIFDFLAAYFAGDAAANFNGGALSVQDIFDFLAAFFSGC